MVLEDSQIYRDLIRLKPDGWTANAWAVRAGVSRTVWTDMRRHGNPSRRTLEKLLSAAGSSLAEFEALRVGDGYTIPAKTDDYTLSDSSSGAWRTTPIASLPHIASASGTAWGNAEDRIDLIELNTGKILGRLPRPEALRSDLQAYAFTVASKAMWPRFKPGRKIAISPQARVELGDDVIVTVSGDSSTGEIGILLAELVSQGSGHIELRQYNPDMVYRVASDQVSAIYRVVGELI